MGWFFPRAATTPDETVTLEAAANLFQGWRAVGGKVTVTTRRLLFTPNRVDLATGGRVIALNRADIYGVEIVPARESQVRPFGVRSGRPVVRVGHADGFTYFLVRKSDQLAAALKDAA